MKNWNWLALALFTLLQPWWLEAEIGVKITPPPFVDVGTVLDLTDQNLIRGYLAGPLGELEAQVKDKIQRALAKPLLYEGLSDSTSIPLMVLNRPLWDFGRFGLGMGITTALQTDTLDLGRLTTRFQTLDVDQDYRLGASAQPLSLAIAFTPWPGEWAFSMGVLGAWSQVAYSPVALTTWAVGSSVQLRWGPSDVRWGLVRWESLMFSAGAGWAQNRYETQVSLALPTQRVEMDLSVTSDVVTISAHPKFLITLDNRGLAIPLQAATEVSLGRTLRLGLSAGGSWVWGASTVGLAGTNPINLASQNGLLSKFFGDQASVAIQGSVGGSLEPRWLPFATVTPSWAVGAFRFGVPLTWRYPGGLSLTLAWGVSV